MIFALALTLFLLLSITRRALEPHCPNCSAKAWTQYSTALECRQCGFGAPAAVAAAVAAPVETGPGQYEMAFHR